MTFNEYRKIRRRVKYLRDGDLDFVKNGAEADRSKLVDLIDELAGGWMDDRYDGKLPPEELLRRVRIAEAIVAES